MRAPVQCVFMFTPQTPTKNRRQQPEGGCHEGTMKEKQKKHGKYIFLKGK